MRFDFFDFLKIFLIYIASNKDIDSKTNILPKNWTGAKVIRFA